MVSDHGRLHGVQLRVRTADAFDGAYRFAMKLRHEKDAGIQRAFTGLVGDNDGTCAAVAFIAALFGAGQTALNAQPIQQRLRGRCIHLHGFPIEKKRNFHSVNPPRYMGFAGVWRCVDAA